MTIAVSDPVQVISGCLENVRGRLSGLHDDEIVHALRQIEKLSRATHSVMLDMVAPAVRSPGRRKFDPKRIIVEEERTTNSHDSRFSVADLDHSWGLQVGSPVLAC